MDCVSRAVCAAAATSGQAGKDDLVQKYSSCFVCTGGPNLESACRHAPKFFVMKTIVDRHTDA